MSIINVYDTNSIYTVADLLKAVKIDSIPSYMRGDKDGIFDYILSHAKCPVYVLFSDAYLQPQHELYEYIMRLDYPLLEVRRHTAMSIASRYHATVGVQLRMYVGGKIEKVIYDNSHDEIEMSVMGP